MGYGRRAMGILQQYYEGQIQGLQESHPNDLQAENVANDDVGILEERVVPRKNLPPMLMKLSERKAEHLDYLGVSYGMTSDLLRFGVNFKLLCLFFNLNASSHVFFCLNLFRQFWWNDHLSYFQHLGSFHWQLKYKSAL